MTAKKKCEGFRGTFYLGGARSFSGDIVFIIGTKPVCRQNWAKPFCPIINIMLNRVHTKLQILIFVLNTFLCSLRKK